MNAFRIVPVNRARSLALAAVALAAAAGAHPAQAEPIRATVIAASKVPDPAKAPYRDCLMRVKLRAEESGGGLKSGAEFIAVAWAFRARVLEPAASARLGDLVRVSAVPYAPLAEKYDQYMTMDDTGDEASPVYWVESWTASPAAAPRPADPALPASEEATVDRILNVFAASGGQTLRPPRAPFIFEPADHAGLLPDAVRLDPPIDGAKLAELVALARERKIELLLLYAPPMAAIYPDFAANIHWDFSRHGRVDRAAAELLARARESGAEVLDLVPTLAEVRFAGADASPTAPAYVPERGSLSARGGAIAGRALAAWIADRAWHGEAKSEAASAPQAVAFFGAPRPWRDAPECEAELLRTLESNSGLRGMVAPDAATVADALAKWLASPESEGARVAVLRVTAAGARDPNQVPASSPALSFLPAGETGLRPQILRIFAAHANAPFGGINGNFVFRSYDHLTDPACWETRTTYWGGASDPPLKAILDFRARLAELGIELLLVIPPSAAALFPDYATNLSWDPAGPRIDEVVAQFAARLRAEGVSVIDLLPDLAAAREETGPDGLRYPIYTPETNHWSPAGARLAARRCAEWIRAQPWSAELAALAGSEKFHAEARTEIKEFGPHEPDLRGGRPLGTPAWREVIHSVRAAPGSPPFDDPNNFRAPVQLVGDSFAQFHQDLSASFYNHLVAESRLPIGLNASAGGGSQFALTRFRNSADKRATRLVIWEVQASFIGAAGKWGGIEPLSIVKIAEKAAAGDPAPPVRRVEVGGARRDALIFGRAAVGSKSKAFDRTGWDLTRFGGRPILKGYLALGDAAADAARGAEFQALVGGVVVARKSISRGPAHAWTEWEIDLSAWAQKNARLELRAAPVPARAAGEIYWGDFELEDGFIN